MRTDRVTQWMFWCGGVAMLGGMGLGMLLAWHLWVFLVIVAGGIFVVRATERVPDQRDGAELSRALHDSLNDSSVAAAFNRVSIEVPPPVITEQPRFRLLRGGRDT